jgi:exosortase E/protease (VPEID-CTERM system)
MLPRERGKPYLKPLTALGLLTVEYLSITFRFDAVPLLRRTGSWEKLGWVGLFAPALIAFGVALWIMAGAKLRDALNRDEESEVPAFLPRLIVHLACFAVFYAVTSFALGGPTAPKGPPELWIALWLASGAGTVLSLVPVAAAGVKPLPLLRELAVPLTLAALLALVAWGAGLATLTLWEHNNRLTLEAVAASLKILLPSIHFDPADAAIGTEQFWVRVAPVCSGYEGIGLVVVFLSAYLVAFRQRFRFPHALLLLPFAIVAVWLFNVVRIVALILIGHAGYPEVALGGFHSKAGWLFFCAVSLGAVWLSQRLIWFARDSHAPIGRVSNPSAPFLLPLLAVVTTSLVSGLFVGDFNYLYPMRVVVGLLVLAWFSQDYIDGLRQRLGGRRIISWDALGIGVAVYLLWIGIASLSASYSPVPKPAALAELQAPLAAVWIMGRVLGSVLVAPLVEELAFRGFLLRRVVASDFTKVSYEQWHWPAVLISSLAFAALHQQWLGGLVAGFSYAYAQKRRGLLSDAIVAHGVTNALIAAQVLLGDYWSLW